MPSTPSRSKGTDHTATHGFGSNKSAYPEDRNIKGVYIDTDVNVLVGDSHKDRG